MLLIKRGKNWIGYDKDGKVVYRARVRPHGARAVLGVDKRAHTRAVLDTPLESLSERIKKAVDSLDDSDGKHWTRGGKPSMKVVEDIIGDSTIVRADVDAASDRVRVK